MLYYCMKYKQNSWDKAVELMASQTHLTLAQVAEFAGVNQSTLKMWKKESEFGEAVYKKTINLIGLDIPGVMDAVKREAHAGNIQAARLFLEFAGKLQKHHLHTITKSPKEQFDMWLKEDKMKVETIDAEVVTPLELIEADIEEKIKNKPKARVKPKEQKKRLGKAINRALKGKPTERQREINRKKSLESYRRQQRAKKVGLEPLGRRKGTARESWYAELEKREKEMGIE